jgi:hypothetical protein
MAHPNYVWRKTFSLLYWEEDWNCAVSLGSWLGCYREYYIKLAKHQTSPVTTSATKLVGHPVPIFSQICCWQQPFLCHHLQPLQITVCQLLSRSCYGAIFWKELNPHHRLRGTHQLLCLSLLQIMAFVPCVHGYANFLTLIRFWCVVPRGFCEHFMALQRDDIYSAIVTTSVPLLLWFSQWHLLGDLLLLLR